jgi:hypothetical protein
VPAGASSRLPIIIGAIAAVAVVGAAGWYFFLRDSGGDSIKFDPTKADALAHASLVQPADLPGKWILNSTDSFDDESSFTADSCSGVKNRMNTVRTAMAATRAGRASIDLGRPTDSVDGTDTGLSMTVDIQRDTKNLAANLSGYQQGIQGSDVPKCLEDSFKSFADTAKVTKVNSSTAAPKGGVATAYEVVLTISGQNLTLRVEDFAWIFSNAAVSLSINGPKADITAELVTAALAKGQAALERTASGTVVVPTPTSPPATSPPRTATTAARTPTPGTRTPTPTVRGTVTVSPAVVTWVGGFCKAVDVINAATDAADQDYSKLLIDQAKVSFQFDAKGFSDALGKAITQERALQPPFQAAQLQEAHIQALTKAKTFYDAAITQVGQARTFADFNAAISALKKGRDEVIQAIQTAIQAAPADVQQALSNC